MSHKKKSVSVRLSESDVRKVKDISKRLGVKEADLLRYTVKQSITKLMPLLDEEVKGVDLIPTLVECGGDLARFLDIDVDDLEHIVNEGVGANEKKIEKCDLDMLALAGLGGASSAYVSYKLSDPAHAATDAGRLLQAFKEYFYEKYLSQQERIADNWNNREVETHP